MASALLNRQLPAPYDSITVESLYAYPEGDGIQYWVSYRGLDADIVAAGILTERDLAPRRGRRSGHYDAAGREITRYRRGRVRHVSIRGDLAKAPRLPGLTDLDLARVKNEAIADREERRDAQTAAGAPTATPMESERGPGTPGAWREKQRYMLGIHLRCMRDYRGASDLSPDMQKSHAQIYGQRFRFADADIGRIDSIIHRFTEEIHAAVSQANVIDTEAPARARSTLRLIVDNAMVQP